MTQFLDGPAAGKTLMLRRNPFFLRVVVDVRTGDVDALDQLDDEPKLCEKIYVYKLVKKLGGGFICRRGSKAARQASGYFPFSEYSLHHIQPGEGMADKAAWQKWCYEQPEVST